jgi:hypothetical protein
MLLFVAACAIAAITASAAPAKNANGVMCLLHAKLAAESAAGSTSTATGHTLIKVLEDGTIEFKTKINNEHGETFIAAHIHQGAVGIEGPPSSYFSTGRRRARARSSRAAWRRHSRT